VPTTPDRGIAKMIRRLERRNRDHTLLGRNRAGFSRAQLIAAISILRAHAPSIEVQGLHPWYRQTLGKEKTIIFFECDGEEAAALIGRKRIPKLPRRVNRIDKPFDLLVRRKAGGRMSVGATIEPEDVARSPGEPLAALDAAAIRALAPLSRLRSNAPETRKAWNAAMLESVLSALDFAAPRMIESQLCRPSMSFKLRQAIAPQRPTRDDEKMVDSLIEAANARFRLPESRRQHILALYTRLHGELRQALAQAIETSPVEDRNEAARDFGALRLAVDNTGSDVRR
jgi:hypothetical protein